MVFSSTLFLFLYLVITLALYYIVPLKLRNLVLLVVSLIFYGWGEPVYIVIMFASIAIDYTHGMLVTRCKNKGNLRGAKGAVVSSVISNLALLFFFKYWDFIAASLSAVGLNFMPRLGLELPIGISFYTFQTMSYTIDVYRGDAREQRNIVTFGTFVTLFPQLIAGPIVRYKDLDDQLVERTCNVEKFAQGVQRFVLGLAKKVLLADNLSQLWKIYQATPGDELSFLGAWLGIIAFALHLYFDFSGYSDMAIGLGKMLGFEFLENFNYPYLSKSATEFWRRWHISLGNWFRDYLYIPLGGNRVGTPRLLFNLLVVWAATGIWHGASWNFLIWGLYYFFWLAVERLVLKKYLDKAPGWVGHIYGLLVILVGWAIFAVEDFSAMGDYLRAMFGMGAGLVDSHFLYYLKSFALVLILGILGATPLAKTVWHKLPGKARRVIFPVLMLLALILSTAYLVDGTYNTFIYFRF